MRRNLRLLILPATQRPGWPGKHLVNSQEGRNTQGCGPALPNEQPQTPLVEVEDEEIELYTGGTKHKERKAAT